MVVNFASCWTPACLDIDLSLYWTLYIWSNESSRSWKKMGVSLFDSHYTEFDVCIGCAVQYQCCTSSEPSERNKRGGKRTTDWGERLSFPHSPYSTRPHSDPLIPRHTHNTHTHKKKSRRTIKRRWNPSPSGTSMCVFVCTCMLWKCVYSGLVLLRVVDDQLGAGGGEDAGGRGVQYTQTESGIFLSFFKTSLFVMLVVDRAILQDALCSYFPSEWLVVGWGGGAAVVTYKTSKIARAFRLLGRSILHKRWDPVIGPKASAAGCRWGFANARRLASVIITRSPYTSIISRFHRAQQNK